jgi:oligopeptidase A
MTLDTTNPLLSDGGLPQFDLISPAHVTPAIDHLIMQCERAMLQAVRPDTPADYDLLCELLDVPLQALDAAWGVVTHLQSVGDTPELRAAVSDNEPKVTTLYTRLSSDLRLYALYKRIAAEQGQQLSAPQRRALSIRLRDSRLSGAELAVARKERFAATLQRSTALSREFSNHLLDATDAFVYRANAEELDGVPQDVREGLAAAARAEGHPGAFKVTLQQPCLGPVMQYARRRELREMLYRANATRASEFGPSERDNGPVIAEMLALCHERAALLGHPHHAAVSLISKMADTPAHVLDFLRDLAHRCRPWAEAELGELRTFARERLGLDTLEVWDFSYASEQLRQARYAFSEQEVKQYFQLDKVLSGLFGIAESLFDISIRAEPLPTWNADVTSYRIERAGTLLGHFFLDPYARAGKNGGAWMQGARPRWRRPGGTLSTAVAYLVTNFASPVDGKPAQLRHGEVVTLFHEFGHGLHFLLSQVEVLGVSGISGVEWDAIELPSQLMENFAWQWPILERISAHTETGAPLPRGLFDKMVAARNFQNGLMMLRQTELALFDMRLYAEPERAEAAQTLMDEVRAETAVLPPPAYNRFQNGFSHIFAGPYAAGYYSYLWAEVLACDAWEVFEREGVLDAITGRRYLESILEVGGSRTMRESFEDFVGRDPRIEALLRQRGLAAEPA